jgi:hypothetical protein
LKEIKAYQAQAPSTNCSIEGVSNTCSPITPDIDSKIRNHILDYTNFIFLSLSEKAFLFNVFHMVSAYCKNRDKSSASKPWAINQACL